MSDKGFSETVVFRLGDMIFEYDERKMRLISNITEFPFSLPPVYFLFMNALIYVSKNTAGQMTVLIQ